MLLGVSCIDMNLIVALDTVRARSDWADFDARVKRERAACPRVTLTYAQLETLRRGVSEAAVCGAPSSVEMRAESLVLRLVARGDVSDYYSDSLQKELQQKIASAAGVGDDYHYVTLTVEAASVIITAKIDVPTSTTVAAMQTSLSSSLGTADKASAFLGIIIESDPTFETKTTSPSPPPPSPSPPPPFPPDKAPLPPPPSPPSSPPPPSPTPLPPGVGVEATSGSVAAQDAGPGLAIGLALGGCLLVAMLAAAVFVWHRKRRTQPPTSSASTAAPQQVEVIVTQPESKKSAAPESLAALLAACGLEHHEKAFKAEGYTLDTLLSSMERGEEAVKSDLRELKLNLGECRQLINHLAASK